MSSYINPQIQSFLDARAAKPPPPPWTVPLEQVRAGFSKLWQRLGAPPRPMSDERDVVIPGPAGPIRCRLYVPRPSPEPLPILIYYHGGGCILMSPEDYASTNTALAADADCLVLAPDYRLAPENPFPAPLEDAYAVLTWTQQNAASLGGDPRRIATAGDSGGGYLTAAVCLEAKRRETPQPCCQVLIYPMIDAAAKTPSRITESHFLSDPVIEWTNRLHFGDHVLDPRASPIRAPDHAGLAPALIVVAELDPLRDEAKAYADLLRAKGVPTTYMCYDGVIHGFFSMGGLVDVGNHAVQHVAGSLRCVFRS